MNEKEELLHEAVFAKLQLENSSESTKATILANIANVVHNRALRLVEELADESQQDVLNDLAKQGDLEKMFAWISENVVNLEDAYNGLLNDYVDELASKHNN